MVYTPRRRRLLRACFLGLFLIGLVLLHQHWNSDLNDRKHQTNWPTKYRRHSSVIFDEREKGKPDESVINIKKASNILDVTDKAKVVWIKHPWKSSLRGFLNVHVWLDWCGSTVNDLRRNIHFPKYPDVRLKTNLFYLEHDAHNFGQRVFGYIHPPRTGLYSFAISSDDSSELWLSLDDDPNNSQLIAWVGNLTDPFWQGIVSNGQFTKYKSQISSEIFLHQNRRYFVEALHKQSTSSDHLLVVWKIPRVGNFSYITRGRISQYIHPHELRNLDVTRYAKHIPLTPAVLKKPITPQKLKDEILRDSSDPQSALSVDDELYNKEKYPTRRKEMAEKQEKNEDILYQENLKDFSLDTKRAQSVGHKMFSSCEYKPSYQVDFKVARYEGVYLIHETSVYPNDKTHMKHVEYYKPCLEIRSTDSHGEQLLDVDVNQFDSSEALNNERRLENEIVMTDQIQENINTNETTVKNITTVKYGEHSQVIDSKLKDYFSKQEKFRKRKILAILQSNYERIISTSNRGNLSTGVYGNYINKKIKHRKAEKKTISNIQIVDNIHMRNSTKKTGKPYEVKTTSNINNGSTIKEQHQKDVDNKRIIYKYKINETLHNNTKFIFHGKNINSQNLSNLVHTSVPETWEVIKERIKRRKTNKVEIKKIESKSFVYYEPQVWHRRRNKTKEPYNMIDDASPLALTVRKLKESGLWNEIRAYAMRKNLLFTRTTWMYVTWKFLRYEKPKKPHDKLLEFIYKQNPSKCRTDGNILLNEKVAKGIVKKYMKNLRKRYGRGLELRRIVNIEENHDIMQGDRYLVELVLGLKNRNESIHISDYVYLPLASNVLCSPSHFLWSKNATVHVIVPVKDQGKWVRHFINDMSELYETTQDPNINVIIVDFNSTDIDIEEALKRSSLKRYQFLQINGSFQRALGIQVGADAVKNPNDIIFTCDLHLDIPNNMIDVLRKHCIQGKMAFSPMVLRLECGFTPTLPYGEWETMGYGLFAIYKSDFDRIGGMNVDEFKTKWGGEDWEMVDRFLQTGMEIERLRVPNFYHYFHSKQGMWGGYGFEDNVSGNAGDNIAEDELVPVYDASSDNAIAYRYNQPLMPEY